MPGPAYEYALEKGKRFPEGEKAMALNPRVAYLYARDIIKGRWPEAEDRIAKNPSASFNYAKDVIKGRWPEGEEIFGADVLFGVKYAMEVVKDRVPLIEKYILREPNRHIVSYAKNVIKGRWPEAEKMLEQKFKQHDELVNAADVVGTDRADPFLFRIAAQYAIEVMVDRWPEAEKGIMAHPSVKTPYVQAMKLLDKGIEPDAVNL